ncbi:MAG TPA: hypothetical protein VMZ03_12765 [Chitinophagaceae bacterium]|nr:hypothetical protein [Chitinophagaceae bacterium]
MKRNFILPLVAVFTAAFVFTSCQPSKVWATKKKNKDKDDDREYREPDYRSEYRPTPPPPTTARYYRRSTPLIISPTPGFVMKPGPNGRFYHNSPSGLLYWKGYDNRFYLDQDDLRKISYDRYEYDEWQRYSRQSR